MTPEAKVKKKVKAVLEKLGCYYFFPATGGYGKSGVPDVVACFKGGFIGIECKAGSNKPTALQELNLSQIREAGGMAVVINEDTVSMLEEWINNEVLAQQRRK